MPSTTPRSATPPPVGSFADDVTVSSLQLIADAATAFSGFTIAAISVVRPDGRLHPAAVAGSDEAREALANSSNPLDLVQRELALADRWGRFRFLPAERQHGLEESTVGWTPQAPAAPSADPDAWQPLDLLIAPLVDGDGTLRGTLALDLPVSGRRPDAAQRALLEKYAEQAGNAVITALERQRVAEQVRLADTARDLVRSVSHSSHASVAATLEQIGDTLVSSFELAGLWIHTLGESMERLAISREADVYTAAFRPDLLPHADQTALRLWATQQVGVIGRAQRINAEESGDDDIRLVEEYLHRHDLGSMLFAPVGAGAECLGLVTLLRGTASPAWSEIEREAIADICRDLGQVLLNASADQRDRELLAELRRLDAYKSEMIATVSHELKNPLASILGNLELLEAEDLDADETTYAVAAITRGAERMASLVDDLQTLGAVRATRDMQAVEIVDLTAVAGSICELLSDVALRRGVALRLETPTEPVRLPGDATELDRMLANLVSNAVKYSPDGGEVRVALSREGSEIEVLVADQGIGISEKDQDRLFTEFFRSTNPRALAEPGTGLGLAIVHRIVARHGGTIRLESRPGAGSTFRVRLAGA